MTLAELYIEARCAEGRGHNYIQVQLRRRSKPKNWDRVRIAPGIYGRCIGECDERGVFLIDVPVTQFTRAADE